MIDFGGLQISSFTLGILTNLSIRLQVLIENGLRTSLRRTLLALLKLYLLESLEMLWVGLVMLNFTGISVLVFDSRLVTEL